MEQVQTTLPPQEGLVKEEAFPINTFSNLEHIDNCRNEICKHIESIKKHTPDGQIDGDTTEVIVNELMNLMAVNDLATAEEIARMRSIFLPRDEATHSAFVQTVSRPTTSPLSEPISPLSPFLDLSPDIAALGDALTTKYETRSTQTEPVTPNVNKHIPYSAKSTQTDPVTTNNNGHALDDLVIPVAYQVVSDHELWERELESIRRPQPLVSRTYKVVTAPLRSTSAQPARVNNGVAAPALSAVKTNPNPVPKYQAGLRPMTHSCTASIINQLHEDCDVISVPDTSDDESEYVPSPTSHRVGGGDFIYRGNGEVEFMSSDEEEERLVPGGGSTGADQVNCYDGTDDLPDYEDTDMGENVQTGGEVGQYYHDMVRYEDSIANGQFHQAYLGDFDRAEDDEEQYDDTEDFDDVEDQDEEGDADPLLVPEPLALATGLQSRGRTIHGCTAVAYTRNTTGRKRSRSPADSRAGNPEQNHYREYRHYVKRHGTGDLSVPVYREKLYVHAESRYIRDEPEHPSFYGYSTNTGSTKAADNALRYQDRFNDVGEIPGPKSSLRLKLDDYVRDSGINSNLVGLEGSIECVLKETFYGSETLDDEQAFRRSWLEDGDIRLYKGFPLVEDIGFVCVGNNARPLGDCYWRGLAYHLQGKSARWDLVKAEHLEYLHHVLTDKTHPRHELYTGQLNTQFFLTHGPVMSHGSFSATRELKANLWQLLHMPHCWTPGVMQQITADLYNIHLVTFSYDTRKNLCSEVSVRGAYNSRHVFMLFTNSNHFQPLTPNEYLG
jgi:hypothetical protein